MNSTLRSALAVLLLGSVSPVIAAGPGVQGTFSVGGGLLDYDTTDGDDSTDAVLTGAASLGSRFDPQWSVQLDLVGEQVTTGSDTDQYASMQGIGGHFTYRFANDGGIGVFAGYGSGNPTDEETWAGAWYGVEGLLFLDNVTLIAQASILDIADHGGEGEGFDDSAYMLRGVGRYFFTKDCKLELDLSYLQGDGVIDGSDDDGDAWEWGASVQTRIAEAPLYGTLAYRGGSYDATTEGDDGEIHMVTLGITYLLGTQDLMDNDRNGISLDTPTAPLRAAGVFSELD
jgi:hypothetical protein